MRLGRETWPRSHDKSEVGREEWQRGRGRKEPKELVQVVSPGLASWRQDAEGAGRGP